MTKTSSMSVDDLKLLKLTQLTNDDVANIDIENSEIGDIMNNAENATDKMHDIIAKLPQMICSPGTICHNNKTKNELKEKYYQAKDTAEHAPEDLRQAKKNYYMFLEGNQGWIKMERENI
mgnify:CR=1 FL=1